MRRSLRLAWKSSIRQPARTGLGILGIAAVGALLFDMLLLSRGLVVSFRDLLDRAGYDVRVLATDAAVGGPRIPDADRTAAALARLPEVEAVVPVTFGEAEIALGEPEEREGQRHLSVAPATDVGLLGVPRGAGPLWTL